MKFSFTGADKMIRNIAELNKRLVLAVEAAAYQEAQPEMTEMKRRCPVDTGALRSSGHVEKPVRNYRDITIRFVFGGPAAPYAIIVHEDLDAWHKVGQAKFVESVLFESGPYMAQRLARRLHFNRATTPAQYGLDMKVTLPEGVEGVANEEEGAA